MKKLSNKKGFTLMEMMIVIAIIVILVAIAVPSFTSSLNSANAATDNANIRAARSAALIKANEADSDGDYYFDMVNGVLEKGAPTGTTHNGSCDNHSKAYIKVTIANGQVSNVAWSAGGDACKGQETTPSSSK